MSLAALLLAALPLWELELRRVEQRVEATGSLSTARAQLIPLGPRLRVQEGERATWTLQLGGSGWLVLQGEGPAGERGRLLQKLPVAAWSLEAEPRRRGGQLSLQLHWQQPLPAGGHERWTTTVPLRAGEWRTVAREGTGEPPLPGALSTLPLAQISELQVRVTEVRD